MPRRHLLALLSTVALAGLVVFGFVPMRAVAAPTTLTLRSVADTFVSTPSPNSNYGAATSLSVSQNSYHVLLRFDVSLPVGSTITDVTLKVYSNSAVSGSLVVHPSSEGWEELMVTSANQPAWQSVELARSGVLPTRNYASATLPVSSVPASGFVSFGLNTTPGVLGSLASRETTNPPQLVLTYEPASPAPSPTGTPTPSPTPTPTPTVASVLPLVENVGFSGTGDVSDDSAIWVDPANPANSVVIADNKASSGGGIGVFGMDGNLIQFRPDGMIGNVDLRSGFPSSGTSMVLVGANNRTNNTLALWSLDTASRTLSPVAARTITTFAPNYGFCMYHSRVNGKFYAFVTPNGAGSIQQFELVDSGAGKVDATLVRTLSISSVTEGCVADDDLGQLYVGQEDVAVWKYGAEPDSGAARVSVDAVGAGHLVADIEGMSLAYGANGSGYLFVSSQGDSTIAVYDRAGSNAFVKSFKVVANGSIDAVTGNDGIDVTSLNTGPQFEQGLIVVHYEVNTGGTTSNLKYVPLNAVVQMNPPAAPVASFTAAPTSGTAPLAVGFTDTSTGSPTSWSWDFGDTGTSTAQNPTHTYATAGTYTTRLTATNSGGSTTATATITVNPATPAAPAASFTASPTSGTAPLAVAFTDTSTGSPTSWSWDFGDTGSSTAQNPTHTYATAGTYTARLTATNSGGSTTATATITVNPAPPANGITFVGSTTTFSGTALNTVSLTKPPGTATGDVLVASFTADLNPSAASVPTGWTAIVNGLSIKSSANSGARVFAYYHVVGSADPASYSWRLSKAVKWGAGVTGYRGVNTATPLDTGVVTAVNTTYTATSITVPSITTTSNGALLIGGVGFDSSNPAATPPTGWTERWEASGGQIAEQADRIQATAGATGTAKWTFSTAKAVAAWRTALKPAS